MPTAASPRWTHKNGDGNHRMIVGVLTLLCEFKEHGYDVTVNGAVIPGRPTDVQAAKRLALEGARQMLNRTTQLLEAVEGKKGGD